MTLEQLKQENAELKTRLLELEEMLDSAKCIQFPLPDKKGDRDYYFNSISRKVGRLKNDPTRGKWGTFDNQWAVDSALEAFKLLKQEMEESGRGDEIRPFSKW